jgi:cytochrome c553
MIRFLVRLTIALSLAAPAARVWAGAPPDPVVEADWAAQDGLYVQGRLQPPAVRRPIDELGDAGRDLGARWTELDRAGAKADDPRWLDAWREACGRRRAARLAPHAATLKRVVFTKHYDLGGSHYAYTEGQSDAQGERTFRPGSALCLLEMDSPEGTVRTLLEDPAGVIRDPDVSYDGKRILFAWKKSDRGDDYHLYEMTVADGKVRQLTFGLGYADYEGAYLPGGDIVFSSTRCVQSVDCFWTEVSNLYACDGNGRRLRRLGYDQVHTNYPSVTPDGRVLYTRWEYNDRGQIFVQSLFQMYPDGTGQTAFYGNNSWFPTATLHARAIPGTDKVVCVFSGHHTHQNGWLGILDPAQGREENSGAQLIAPLRQTDAVHVDRYGQAGDQFQYPYPLSETEFLVTLRPYVPDRGGPGHFAVYWVAADGRRELLAWDPKNSCNQSVPLAPRPAPRVRPSQVDDRKSTGTVVLQDVYEGPGLAGVPRGTVKTLRVVALEFRAAVIGSNNNGGPAGGALISTPVAIGNGAWDPKVVLGEATVYEDGSACFTVPARTAVYFQALDAKGHAVQTMRSWATLQPGETASCVGCHESKNTAPPAAAVTQALKAGPQDLRPWYGPPRGFSFRREIQPILDRRCIRCHDVREKAPPEPVAAGRPAPAGAAGAPAATRRAPPAPAAGRPPDPAGPAPDEKKPAFSLLDAEVVDAKAKRKWSDAYLALTSSRPRGRREPSEAFAGWPENDLVNWVHAQSAPPMLPPYSAGAAKSRLITMLEQGHNGVRLTREELDKFACWIDLLVPFCGDYVEANAWSPEEAGRYQHFLEKRRRAAAEAGDPPVTAPPASR